MVDEKKVLMAKALAEVGFFEKGEGGMQCHRPIPMWSEDDRKVMEEFRHIEHGGYPIDELPADMSKVNYAYLEKSMTREEVEEMILEQKRQISDTSDLK
jgi:hypothetical protein